MPKFNEHEKLRRHPAAELAENKRRFRMKMTAS